MVGIYTITSPTNKVYVGQSWNVLDRLCDYKSDKCKNQSKIFASLKKYGWESHKFEVVMELRDDISQATLDCWEWYFYDLYKANHELLNLREPGSHGKMAESSKLKMSAIHKGKIISNEQKHKLRKALSGEKSPFYGKPKPDKQRLLFSQNHADVSGSKNPRAKAVLQLSRWGELIKEWGCISEAANGLGMTRDMVRRRCNNVLPKYSSTTFENFVLKFK